MGHKIIRTGPALLFLCVYFSSCYYDKDELINPTTGNCDTTQVTFTQFVNPLITQQCVSCHSVGNPSGNVLLDGYLNIKQQVDNGKLLGSLSHEVGFSPMPKNGTKLEVCQLSKMQRWVLNGAPNN
jgi:mono/diheme cytochrome c family protein